MSFYKHPRPQLAVGWGPAALAIAWSLGAPLHAEPAPAFSDLVRQAQRDAPRLAEADANVARAEGLRRQAGVRPNPTVSLEAENFAGTRPYQGFDQTETTLSVAQELELGGKRPARVAAGQADVQSAQRRRDQSRSDLIYDLALAYVEADAADQRVTLAENGLALAEEDARIARTLVQAGKEAELRTLSAQSAVAQATAELQAARAGRLTALSNLTALAGAPAPFTSLSEHVLGHADRAEPVPLLDPLTAPAVLAAQSEREAAARRVRVEQTRAAPNVTVSLGVRRLNGADVPALVAAEAGAGRASTALVGGVSIPFPLFDRNRGNISAAQADQRAAEARLNAARLEAEASSRSAIAQSSAAEGRVSAAAQGQRSAEEAYRLTRIGYEGGKLALIEVISARRALAEANIQLLTARIERLNAEAALARLQGRIPFEDR